MYLFFFLFILFKKEIVMEVYKWKYFGIIKVYFIF